MNDAELQKLLEEWPESQLKKNPEEKDSDQKDKKEVLEPVAATA